RNLDTPVWAVDSKHVFYMGRPLPGADPKTFEVLLGNYARDARGVFFGPFRSRKIDHATFRVLNANFGVDSSRAYFVITPIRGAAAERFRVLDASLVAEASGVFLQAGYAADATSVWFASGAGIYRIPSADPGTFVSLANRFGYDREHVYFEHSTLPGADPTTWRVWRGLLSVDKKSVFYTNKRIAGVDRVSIRLLSADGTFMDRHRVYSSGKACLRDPDDPLGGKAFDKLLDEWPQVV
ncbi:MAG TPA: DKNYY domain-containing protein, partial [Verrucomicrobiae bacterium]